MRFNVAGITFARDRNTEIGTLRPVGSVRIVPEPDNPFDDCALRIEYKGLHLGYVPKGDAQQYIIENAVETAEIANYTYVGDPEKHPPKGFNEVNDGVLGSITLQIGTDDESSGKVYGGKYLRVTRFLKYFDPYGGGDGLLKWAFDQGNTFEEYKAALDKTADDGTAMHAAIERFLATGERTDALPEGWDAFNAKFQPEACYMERRFFDNVLMVTGQPDFVGYATIGGERRLVVMDWKSSKKPSLKHKLQLAIYAKNSEWEGVKPSHAVVLAFGAENNQRFSASVIDSEAIGSFYMGMRHLLACMDAVGVYVKEYWSGEDD